MTNMVRIEIQDQFGAWHSYTRVSSNPSISSKHFRAVSHFFADLRDVKIGRVVMGNVMCCEGMSKEDESEIGLKDACEDSSCPKGERVSCMGLAMSIGKEECSRTI